MGREVRSGREGELGRMAGGGKGSQIEHKEKCKWGGK